MLCARKVCCQASTAKIQSRPDSGLGFQAKVLQPFSLLVPERNLNSLQSWTIPLSSQVKFGPRIYNLKTLHHSEDYEGVGTPDL